MREKLKKFYLTKCEKMDELVHKVVSPIEVDLLNQFVELSAVDANEVLRDTINVVEREFYRRKQKNFKPVELKEVFFKELSLLLISGIAGIGKTWLLKKYLLDWASNRLYQNIDMVLHLECRKLNQFPNISILDELVQVFYKKVFKDFNVCECFSILFVIDGLDEFAYFDELINHNPLILSEHPIVNTLADASDFKKHKCIVAGRVGAILQYKDKVTECRDKLTIQVMGFNDKGIHDYIEKISYNKREAVKNVIKSSKITKAMGSVPFYLSAMCTVIGTSTLSGSYSFFGMTELCSCVFLYFLQKHINRNDQPVYEMMRSESNKQYILRVCEIAWNLLIEGKVVFSQKEIKPFIEDFDTLKNIGFIEKVESQFGFQYQFVHFTLMEFCASVHVHICLSPEEIISKKRLRSCLPMICGLANENKGCFVRFLSSLKTSNTKRNSLLNVLYGKFCL